MKKIISLLIACSMIISCFTVSSFTAFAADDTENTTYAQETVQGGAILHCFNWSYNNIRERLDAIYEAGYTAVQVSPVQTPKDYNPAYTDSNSNWWKMYQPLGFSIAENGTNWFGGEAELTALCTEAESYGIKVIVDIVANHLAEDGSKTGVYKDVDPALRDNPDYWHADQDFPIDYSDRRSVTQDSMGLPDLNTGNKDVQNYVLQLLKDCVDCGVDGFRFDAAKHIEVPEDGDFGSDFWPTVINGINEYKSGLFIYGEILGRALTDIDNYTEYMAVTDDETSASVREGAAKNQPKGMKNSVYKKGEEPDEAVLWAESHDNYNNDGSNKLSAEVIQRAWAIVGSRADSTSLYLARPNSILGEASSDNTWKSAPVAEVNKFKNYFNGTDEHLAQRGKVVYNIRNGEGLVLVNLKGGEAFEVPNPDDAPMSEGTYVDRISGNTITVTADTISGTTDSTGIAVIYNYSPKPSDPVEGDVITGDADGDGVVNAKDRIVLTRYLAKWSGYENSVDLIAADVNADSDVNAKDRIILTRYLAKWKGYEKLPLS